MTNTDPGRFERPFMETLVALLAVETGGELLAGTVTSFSETAHYPAGLWVSLDKDTALERAIRTAGRFSLSILGKRQRKLAVQFAGASGTAAPADHLPWQKSAAGYRFLEGSMAAAGCEVWQTVELGGQTLFVATITEGDFDSRVALDGPLLSSEV